MTVKRGTAGEKALKAARLRFSAAGDKGNRFIVADLNRAEVEEGFAREAVPAVMAATGVGDELAPIGTDCALAAYFKNTTEDPDYVAHGASRDRLELAHEANALELALDTSDTIEARNSVEKMLAHRYAGAHKGTMKLIAQLNHLVDNTDRLQTGRDFAEIERKNIMATRLANSVARMMATCDQSALTMQKLRAGPHQVVTVQHQHVTVEGGGQAVVAGQIGSRKGARNRRGTPEIDQ